MRIIAIDMALKGADFIDVFRYFLENDQTEADSFSSASRIFRGAPVTGGAAFTKDTVYLHGLLSVHTFFRWSLKNQRLKLCRSLFAGKMALHDVIALEPWFDSGWIIQPTYLPHWVQRANGLTLTIPLRRSQSTTWVRDRAIETPHCLAHALKYLSIRSRGKRSIPAGTGVCVVKMLPARTASMASAYVNPLSTMA